MDVFWGIVIFLEKIAKALVTILGVPWAVFVIVKSIGEFRQKQKSSQAEIETKLLKLFTDLVWVAHGRGGTHISEKCIEQMFRVGCINKEDLDKKKGGEIEPIIERMREICTFNLPVGLASQEAAIISLGELGNRYKILRRPAEAALKSLLKNMPEVLQETIKSAKDLLKGK